MIEPPRSRRGVALPMALLVLVVLTILLAAGFAALSSERRVHANDEAALDAFTLAETGLEVFIAKRDSFGFTAAPPTLSESTRIALGGGYADVILKRIRKSMGSGADQCGKQPAMPGVAVPGNPGYTQNGGPLAPQGNPPVDTVAPTPTQMADSVKIDWAGLSGGTALTPDITIPPGAWPSFSNPNYWPTILVKGDFALPGNGQGTLIVTGGLTISGNITWDGVLLVGDNLTSNGNNAVNGATVTGLNVKLGATLPQGDIGNGTKSFNYNSCNIAKAMAGMGQLVGYSNAWVDNWPTY